MQIEIVPKTANIKQSDIDTKKRRIVFKHDRCIGDALMFTAGIRDFKLLFPDILINAESNHNFLWENNPYLERGLNKNQPGVEFYEVGYPAVGNANNAAIHFTTMFLLDMIAVADLHQPLPISLGEFCASFANGSVGDPSLGNPGKNQNAREPFISLRERYKKHCKEFARQRGDIHLTSEEKENNLIERDYGVKEYWVIAPGGKWDFTAKLWDWRRFQDVIDYFEGKIKFVVIGKSEHIQFDLKNTINLIDYFNDDIRGLIPLVYHATGTVCVPSFLMHLTAAIPSKIGKGRKPCVSIFGGREPTTWSWYCNHQILHTNGAHSCCQPACWRARIEPVEKDEKHNKSLCYRTHDVDGKKVQACMDTIKADDVIRAIERYYEGDMYRYQDGTSGRLKMIYRYGALGSGTSELKNKMKEVKESVVELKDEMEELKDAPITPLPETKDHDFMTEDLYKEDTEYLPTSQKNDISLKPGQRRPNEPYVYNRDKYDAVGYDKDKQDYIYDRDKARQINSYTDKRINLLGNMNTDGGGEQSFCMIANLLRQAGWQVKLYPWGKVNERNASLFKPEPCSFKEGMINHIDNSPILFYANDRVWDFVKNPISRQLVDRCRSLIVGINYVNGPLPKCDWLSESGKLKAVIFQNKEKQQEWARDQIGFDSTKQIVLFGAIDLNKFLDIEPSKRSKDDELVVLKHCKPDKRKFVTTESTGGDKIHVWQKCLDKDLDTKFYERLLKNVKSARFEFMAAPSELVNHFRGNKRMQFYEWNAMPITDFLSRGHVYLYRTSNRWRDQYPRVVAEALAAGLPVLTEPRDGTADRVVHGDTGFQCIDYDGFQYALKLMERKETYRLAMGMNAKQWAKDNLDPTRWVSILEELLC